MNLGASADEHPAAAAHDQAEEPSTLRAVSPVGLHMGTAVDMQALAEDRAYREVLATQFASVTAENVMKWERLEPVRGVYDWGPADELVALASDHDQRVRGHTLVWHNQLPGWLQEGAFGTNELRAILREHIHATVGRFRGAIWQWHVVNEAIGDDGAPRESIWRRELGPGYLADAFRWAHEADPDAQLFYNDCNVEGMNPKSDAMYALVAELRADGVPIHGVGVQGHLDVSAGFPPDIAENLRRFDRLGMATAITEADVRVPPPSDLATLHAQARGFGMLLRAALRTSGCASFTVWGFCDRYSWIPGWFPGHGEATLFDERYAPKYAYEELHDQLATVTSWHARSHRAQPAG